MAAVSKEQLKNLFARIEARLSNRINIYIIGGASAILSYCDLFDLIALHKTLYLCYLFDMASLEQDDKLQKAIETLKREFSPTRLFLFGSRAAGTAKDESDYDFLVVVQKTDLDRIQNMNKARKLLQAEANIAADVFVYPEAEFEEWKNELNSIPEAAHNLGLEIPLG